MKKRTFRSARFLIFGACLLIAGVYFAVDPNISIEALLNLTPQSPWIAAVILWALYAIKSATVFFPLIILEIAAGHLFAPFTALGINFIGMLIILTIPYFIGKAAGIEAINKLIRKYPRFGDIIGKQQDNSL
jgi:uncharacterized membrane protein YdjX (TVP38/TMEM64 family)